MTKQQQLTCHVSYGFRDLCPRITDQKCPACNRPTCEHHLKTLEFWFVNYSEPGIIDEAVKINMNITQLLCIDCYVLTLQRTFQGDKKLRKTFKSLIVRGMGK